ncbi:hypothetical protein EV426DRAFT_275892 [Tirmania nivea]|nr:hypothetical protein EV426DRAFT_275892 [Tirmania nivea]
MRIAFFLCISKQGASEQLSPEDRWLEGRNSKLIARWSLIGFFFFFFFLGGGPKVPIRAPLLYLSFKLLGQGNQPIPDFWNTWLCGVSYMYMGTPLMLHFPLGPCPFFLLSSYIFWQTAFL